MFLLLTDDQLQASHYPTLQFAIKHISKIHIKFQPQSSTPIDEINHHILSIVENDKTLLDKIVVHLNPQLLQIETSYISSHLIEKKFKDVFKKIHSHNFHLSEELANHYLNILKNNSSDFQYLVHQYNISASIHHLKLNENYQHFHYLIYGPVFPSISKSNYLPSQTLDKISKDIQEIEDRLSIPIIAVGGIILENFTQVLSVGFAGIALRGYIWQHPSPMNALQQFLNEWKKQTKK